MRKISKQLSIVLILVLCSLLISCNNTNDNSIPAEPAVVFSESKTQEGVAFRHALVQSDFHSYMQFDPGFVREYAGDEIMFIRNEADFQTFTKPIFTENSETYNALIDIDFNSNDMLIIPVIRPSGKSDCLKIEKILLSDSIAEVFVEESTYNDRKTDEPERTDFDILVATVNKSDFINVKTVVKTTATVFDEALMKGYENAAREAVGDNADLNINNDIDYSITHYTSDSNDYFLSGNTPEHLREEYKYSTSNYFSDYFGENAFLVNTSEDLKKLSDEMNVKIDDLMLFDIFSETDFENEALVIATFSKSSTEYTIELKDINTAGNGIELVIEEKLFRYADSVFLNWNYNWHIIVAKVDKAEIGSAENPFFTFNFV